MSPYGEHCCSASQLTLIGWLRGSRWYMHPLGTCTTTTTLGTPSRAREAYTPPGAAWAHGPVLSVKLRGFCPRSGLIPAHGRNTHSLSLPGLVSPGRSTGRLIPFGADFRLPKEPETPTQGTPIPSPTRLTPPLSSPFRWLRGSGRDGPTHRSAGGFRAALGLWPRTFV